MQPLSYTHNFYANYSIDYHYFFIITYFFINKQILIIMLTAQIILTLSYYPSFSVIVLDKFSKMHPVSVQG